MTIVNDLQEKGTKSILRKLFNAVQHHLDLQMEVDKLFPLYARQSIKVRSHNHQSQLFLFF